MKPALTSAGILALAAAGLLLAMLALALAAGGVTQQDFESIAPAHDFTMRFMAARPAMAPTLALDNLFIIAYVGALALGLGALITPETRVAGVLAIAGMVTVGLLDLAENLHFLTMYAVLDAGGALSLGEIALQMWASLLKWHIAYLALFLAGFAIRADGLLSGALVWSLRVVLPVVGVLAATAPDSTQPVLLIVRYALMLAGFVLFAVIFFARARRARPA